LGDGFVKGIIGLGEVEREIPFIHAGRERKFPVNCLFPGQNLHIWAEFGDLCLEFEKFPVNFLVLVKKDGNAGRDRPCLIELTRQSEAPNVEAL